MRNRGKPIIFTIFGIALAAAVFGLSYWRHQGRRCLEFWGPEAAQRIVRAPSVFAWELAPPDMADVNHDLEVLSVGDQRLLVNKRVDISQSRGFVNVRRGLVSDGSYDWNAPADSASIPWRYALQFHDEQADTIVLISVDGRYVGQTTGRCRSSAPVQAGLLDFLHEHLPPKDDSTSKTGA